MQLEEELRLRRVEIEGLQARVRSTDGTSSNGEVVPGQPEGQALQETGEAALASCRQEVDSLRAALDSKNQEISDLKQKVQQATKENMEMMDAWKVKSDAHSQRLERPTSEFCSGRFIPVELPRFSRTSWLAPGTKLTKMLRSYRKVNHLLVATFHIQESKS